MGESVTAAAPHTRIVAALAFLIATTLASRSSAQASTRPIVDALVLQGRPRCGDRALLAAHIVSWLGRGQIDGRLEVQLAGGSEPAAAVSFAILRDGRSIAERRFEHPPAECGEQRAALGLAIAIALDGTLLANLAAIPPAPMPPPATEARSAPTAPPPVGPRIPAGPSKWLAVSEAMVLVEVLPGIGWGGQLGIERTGVGPLVMRVGVLGAGAVGVEVGRGSADAGLVAGRLDGCLRRALRMDGPVALGVCAGAAGGMVLAQGRGFDEVATARLPWVALLGRVELQLGLGRHVALRLALDGLVPLIHLRLAVLAPDDSPRSVRPFAPLGAMLALGASVAF
jgi:hypothetical protein